MQACGQYVTCCRDFNVIGYPGIYACIHLKLNTDILEDKEQSPANNLKPNIIKEVKILIS